MSWECKLKNFHSLETLPLIGNSERRKATLEKMSEARSRRFPEIPEMLFLPPLTSRCSKPNKQRKHRNQLPRFVSMPFQPHLSLPTLCHRFQGASIMRCSPSAMGLPRGSRAIQRFPSLRSPAQEDGDRWTCRVGKGTGSSPKSFTYIYIHIYIYIYIYTYTYIYIYI